MKKGLAKVSKIIGGAVTVGALVLAISVPFGFVGCEANASSNDYTAYLYFNGQYIKYDGVQNFDTHEDGRVDLKMTDGKKIELYSPGNVTIVSKDAIPEPPTTADKKEGK